MTKVTILGQEPKNQKKLKPIEFVKSLRDSIRNSGIQNTGNKPSDFDNIELIRAANNNQLYYDIMFAYNKERVAGIIFLGHFNDGVVE